MIDLNEPVNNSNEQLSKQALKPNTNEEIIDKSMSCASSKYECCPDGITHANVTFQKRIHKWIKLNSIKYEILFKGPRFKDCKEEGYYSRSRFVKQEDSSKI